MKLIGKLSLVAAALALTTGSAGVAHADLIVNGGFETGNFSGWTLVDNNGTSVQPSGGLGGYAPHSGNFYAALGNVGCCGSLSQTVSDTAGTSYTLSLWYASNGTTPNELDVHWNGTQLFLQTNIPAQPYTQLTFTVTGTGSDTLAISEQDNPDYLALDDVSLNPTTAVPEPASLALLGSGLLGFGLIRRRRKQV